MRKDIYDNKDYIMKLINEKQSKAHICRIFKCKPSTLEFYLKKFGISYKGNQGAKGKKISNKYLTATEYIKCKYVSSHILKNKLIRDGVKEHRCEKCGNTHWLGKPIPLELHHKDGNHYNNNMNNLELQCPNCHALEDNNSGAANKKE